MREGTENPVKESNIDDWRKNLEPNCIKSWKKYEGPGIPQTPDDVEALKTQFLKDIWNLKQTLSAVPRHIRFTREQFNQGFDAERQQIWIPLFQGLIDLLHQWRKLYPGIDITRRQGYRYLVELKDELTNPQRHTPLSFQRELVTVANSFETSFGYCKIIDDAVILEKFALLVEAFSQTKEHYLQDFAAMEANERLPRMAPAIA